MKDTIFWIALMLSVFITITSTEMNENKIKTLESRVEYLESIQDSCVELHVRAHQLGHTLYATLILEEVIE